MLSRVMPLGRGGPHPRTDILTIVPVSEGRFKTFPNGWENPSSPKPAISESEKLIGRNLTKTQVLLNDVQAPSAGFLRKSFRFRTGMMNCDSGRRFFLPVHTERIGPAERVAGVEPARMRLLRYGRQGVSWCRVSGPGWRTQSTRSALADCGKAS